MKVSAKEALESLDEMKEKLEELLPKKEDHYGNKFRFGLLQAAIRISEKADRLFYGDKEELETLEDTIIDIVGWASIAHGMLKKDDKNDV